MCEYCDNIQTRELTNYTNHLEKVWIEIDNGFLLCLSSGIYVLKQPILYCPFCGKFLKVERKPQSPEECTNIFEYLSLLDTFTDRSGIEYEKCRYAADYVSKHADDMNYQEMIAHIENKFAKKEKNEKK